MTWLLAASWSANFSTWDRFANWLGNSNFASLILGLALPGAVLVAWHWVHTRRHFDRIHAHHEWHTRQVARYMHVDGVDVDDHPEHGRV